jgi:hypothetical protein
MNAQFKLCSSPQLDISCQNLVNYNLPIKEKFNNNPNFVQPEKANFYQGLNTKIPNSPPKFHFKLESMIPNLFSSSSHPVFQPLSCLLPLGDKNNLNSSPSINTRTFDFYINNQNNMREYENILSEQYILSPVTFQEVIYGQDSPLRKINEDQGNNGLSLSISSAISTQNITSGNEGSDSDKEKDKNWLKKRKRDSERFACSEIVKPEVSAAPKKRKNKINRAQELFEDSFVKQTPLPQIIPQPTFNINDVYPLETFNSDLDGIKLDVAHNFMKEQFPNMYTRDNFYRHIKLLNEKRSAVLTQHAYPTGKTLQAFSILNTLQSSPEVSLTLAPRKVWHPAPDTEPILGST